VERLVVLPLGRIERKLATLTPFLAIDSRAWLILNVQSENQEWDMKGHHQGEMPSYPGWLLAFGFWLPASGSGFWLLATDGCWWLGTGTFTGNWKLT